MKAIPSLPLVSLLLPFAALPLARGATVTLSAARDTTLYESATGALSNGGGDYLFTGNTAQSASVNTRRALIGFDIASTIPAGATITSVTLTLTLTQASDPDLENIFIYRVSQSWAEDAANASGNEGAGAPSTPGDTTWLRTGIGANTWATPGGDFAAASSASTAVGDPGVYTWSGAGLVADVQGMLDSPGSDFGWILLGDESGSGTAQRFNSRQNASGPPSLQVIYTPVPEPATGVALTLGLAILTRRRRG